jgi:hypothetical protein
VGTKWYYGRGSDITGPVSGAELSGLAAAGGVLPTDMVWRDGVEQGVPAGRVRNLLWPSPAAAPAEMVAPAAAGGTESDRPATEVSADPATPDPNSPEPNGSPESPARWQPLPRPARAIAGKGVIIVAQDGTTVKYRGKCATCGREDASWKSIPIPRGLTRVWFFCPKCRRRQEGDIQGIR